MADSSKKPSGFSSSREEQGFFGSSLFKVMIAVLLVATIAVGAMYYYRHQPGESGPEEVVAFADTLAYQDTGDLRGVEDMEPSVIETRTTYEYTETGDTYTLVNDGGPGPWEFTCTSIAEITTSSVLASAGKSSYITNNMTDLTESTAWVEGNDGIGIGEWIEFTLTDEYKKWGYTNEDFIANTIYGDFIIQTGYAKSPAAWKSNSRPVKFQCYLNGEALSIIQLQDTPNVQAFSIFNDQTGKVALKEGDIIRFEIIDVVKGAKDEDACISEFHIEGNCG